MTISRDAIVLSALSVSAAVALCLASLGRPEARQNEPFVAFTEDFIGFDRWERFDIPADPHPITVHEDGPRSVYLNTRPPSGSLRFPVGTIIVKTIRVGERADWPVFAMVKRGGGYNRAGAPGWEWFQLALEDRNVRIRWRGAGPPNAEAGYGSGNDCNLCHMEWAADNDAVQAKAMTFARLSPMPDAGRKP